MSKYLFDGLVINEAQGDEEQESDDAKNNNKNTFFLWLNYIKIFHDFIA